MKLIVCADPKNGLLFNRRRQSQDRELRKRILSIIGEEKLYLSAYSAGQFTEPQWQDRLVICEEPRAAAAAGADWYFAEGQPLHAAVETGAAVDTVILYRWDKVYPADVYLDLPLTPGSDSGAAGQAAGQSDSGAAGQVAGQSDSGAAGQVAGQSDSGAAGKSAGGWQQSGAAEFAGSSHEKITEEIYIRL